VFELGKKRGRSKIKLFAVSFFIANRVTDKERYNAPRMNTKAWRVRAAGVHLIPRWRNLSGGVRICIIQEYLAESGQGCGGLYS